MIKHYFLLQLELNLSNHMIFKIVKNSQEMRCVIGFLVLEDYRRPATLDDFEYLKSVYEDGTFEWEDEGNLIVVSIYTYDEINQDEKESLLELASTLVEFKPYVTHRVNFFVSSELLDLRDKDWENQGCYKLSLQYLLNTLEKKINIENLSDEDFNHLSQD